jgi:hypothetical protein
MDRFRAPDVVRSNAGAIAIAAEDLALIAKFTAKAVFAKIGQPFRAAVF